MPKTVKGAIKKEKEQTVSRLAEELKNVKSIGLIDLRRVPDRQFQSIKKKLRGKVKFFFAKNSIIQRALQKAGKATDIAGQLQGPSAIFTTDMEPFSLFKFVKKNKGKAAAKPGQIAPFDLIVPAGETTLPPGPALTELKQAGIDARIASGKIMVAKDSTVAKTGSKITGNVAKALQKLGIEPFEVGVRIASIWESGTLYLESVLDVDEKKFMQDLRAAGAAALNLSFNAAYPTKSNIKLLISKAYSDSRNLALNAEIYEKEIIPFLLSKAKAQAKALSAMQKPVEEKKEEKSG